VEAWTSEGTNDMRNLPTGKRLFGAIEFDVLKAESNAGKTVLRLDPTRKVAPSVVTIPIDNVQCKSLYFMHCLAHSVAGKAVAGAYDISYTDGTTERIWLRNGTEIGSWWGISDGMVERNMGRRAWWGPNPSWKTVGIHMVGWNNPHPEKQICALRAEALDASGRGGGIMLAAISCSDQPVAFEPRIRSYGLPDCWAQAAVYYAIGEGLAGIEDKGPVFRTVSVSPRWSASSSNKAQATLHYPASDGYCSYDYALDRGRKQIKLDLTGSFTRAHVHCLLPSGKARRVRVDGVEVPFKNVTIEKSHYVDFNVDGLPQGAVKIDY
jgi:hypothetical protein